MDLEFSAAGGAADIDDSGVASERTDIQNEQLCTYRPVTKIHPQRAPKSHEESLERYDFLATPQVRKNETNCGKVSPGG